MLFSLYRILKNPSLAQPVSASLSDQNVFYYNQIFSYVKSFQSLWVSVEAIKVFVIPLVLILVLVVLLVPGGGRVISDTEVLLVGLTPGRAL